MNIDILFSFGMLSMNDKLVTVSERRFYVSLSSSLASLMQTRNLRRRHPHKHKHTNTRFSSRMLYFISSRSDFPFFSSWCHHRGRRHFITLTFL